MTTHTISLARHTAQVVGLMGVLVLGTWDSYGTEQLLLRHGPEWDGLAIDATFHNVPNDEGVTVLADTDGLVPVPPEACMRASKYATITFRGVQDGVQRISCNLPYMVLDHAQVPGANSTATPSENAQALAQMQDLRDGAVDAKRHAEAARDGAANSAAAANASAKNAEGSKAAAASSATAAAGSEKAAAGDAKTASDAAAEATDAKAAAVAAQKDAAASKAAAANSSAAAKTSEDAAAKSAAEADNTANSINNSMMQIAANKEAVRQLKEDLGDVKEVSSVYKLLSSDDYTYVEGKNTGFDVAKKVLTHNDDNYAAYAQIDVTPGEKYIIYCGGKKSTSTTYPVVMLAFSKDGTSYLPPENYNYDPFAGVSENTNTKVNGYSVTVPEDAKYMFVSTFSKGGMPIIIYKHIEVDSAKYNGLLGKIEKDKNGLYGLDDLNFVLKAAQRHFFDTNKMCYEIVPNEKMFGANSNIYPKTDIKNAVDIASDSTKIRFGYWGDDTAESYLSISGVNPFRVYEVDFKSITAKDKLRCYVNFRNPSGKSFSLDINFVNKYIVFNKKTVTTDIDVSAGNFTVRIYLMRSTVAIYFINSINGCKYAGTFDISDKADMCNPDVSEKYTLCIGAVLSNGSKIEIGGIRSYITCGCAQADIRLLKTFDCKPIISQGKAYLAMSCRGYNEGYGESYCGIFSFDLNTFSLELTGQIFTSLDGIEAPCVGTSIIFDENTGLWHLYYSDRHGVTSKDPRFGKTVFTNEKFSHALTDKTLYDWLEDPDVYYNKDMNRYYMVVSVKEIDSSVQYPYSVAFLQSNNINGPFSLLSKTNNTLGGTGTSWVLLNDELFATSGTSTDGIAIFDGKTYTKLPDANLDKTYGGFRSWGCVVPIFDGQKTRYVLVTFDRNRGYGAFSYGNMFVYLSRESNEGMDYTKIYHTLLIN